MPYSGVEPVKMTLPGIEGAEIVKAEVIGTEIVKGKAIVQVNLYHRKEFGAETSTYEERTISLKPQTFIVGKIVGIKAHDPKIIDGVCELFVDIEVETKCMARQL